MVNPAFIPNALVGNWARTAQAKIDAWLQVPGITLGHLEELLEAQACELMLPVSRSSPKRRKPGPPRRIEKILAEALAQAPWERRTKAKQSDVHDP